MTVSVLTTDAIVEKFGVNRIFARRVAQVARSDETLDDIARLIEEKPKPFVKWVGGKRQLLRQFREVDLYPPDLFDPVNSRYFEPFVGGGAVFFDLLPKNAELSDLNKELVTTYNIIKNDTDRLIKSLKKHVYDKEYYLDVRARQLEDMTDVEIASRFIYLNRTGFNGMYRVNKKGQFNVPFGRYNNPLICDEDNLRRVSKALEGVTIKHQDYKKVLDSAERGDFVYLDPPYFPVSETASFTSYTAEGFAAKEQTELRDVFVELHKRGCFVMLSNSDTPFINDIYSDIEGVNIRKVSAARAISAKGTGRAKVQEVLVTNY